MARRPQTAGGKRTSLAMRAAKKHAPSNTGEDEEVDSHSSSAASSESEQQTDDGGGKQQAGAYEEADEVDTDEEANIFNLAQGKNHEERVHGYPCAEHYNEQSVSGGQIS
jgi:hypothetical protein